MILKSRPPFLVKHAYLESLVFIIIGFLIYSNVLNGEFVSDDYMVIVENPAVRDLSNLQAIWHSFYTRFWVGFTFALNYAFDGYHTFGFHLINIIIHIVNAHLVRWWVLLVFRTPYFKFFKTSLPAGRIAFFAALIFLVHPIQTQGVSFVTQRAVSLAAFFYLLTMNLYLKFRFEHRSWYLLLSLWSMAMGLFTKECVLMLPVVLLIHEIFFFNCSWGEIFRCLKRIGLYVVIAILYLSLHLFDRNVSNLDLKGQLDTGYFDWNYFWTEINVMLTYVRLFFFPVGQIFDYDYPLAKGFTEIKTIISFVLIASLLSWGVYQFQRNRLIAFVIVWLPVTIFLEILASCTVHRGVIYEHWLYLPMIGFSFVIVWMLWRLIKNERIWQIAVVCLITVFCCLTYSRNFVWKNEIVFWLDNLTKTPNKANVYYATGIAYDRKDKRAIAVKFYERAIQIDPQHFLAMNNLAINYYYLGDPQLAESLFKKAIAIKPSFTVATSNLNWLYQEAGQDLSNGYRKEP